MLLRLSDARIGSENVVAVLLDVGIGTASPARSSIRSGETVVVNI